MRTSVAGLCAAALWVGVSAQTSPSPDRSVQALVASATGYVETYERELSYLLASEVYTQQEDIYPQMPAQVPVAAPATPLMNRGGMSAGSGANIGARVWTTKSEFRGELFLTFVPADRVWVAVHDVASVDGKKVVDREDLQTLLRDKSVTEVAQRVKDRNARFNIGRVERNFNEPTFALRVLEREVVGRFTFTPGEVTTEKGVALVALFFHERDRPTIVRGRQFQSIEASGDFTIEAATGRVQRTRIRFNDAELSGGMTTVYVAEPALKLWVPSRFTEEWSIPDGTLKGDARYSNWRRFQGTGRIVR